MLALTLSKAKCGMSTMPGLALVRCQQQQNEFFTLYEVGMPQGTSTWLWLWVEKETDASIRAYFAFTSHQHSSHIIFICWRAFACTDGMVDKWKLRRRRRSSLLTLTRTTTATRNGNENWSEVCKWLNAWRKAFGENTSHATHRLGS